MDKFGVPKKINRHVIKAVYDQEYDNMNFSNICNTVELTMKNNVPVANLQSAVRQSLRNLCKLGAVEKRGINYYRTSKNQEGHTEVPSKRIHTRIFKRTVQDEQKSTLNPNKRNRRALSEDSLSEDNTENSRKRLRTDKLLSRKGQQVYLPKVRIQKQEYQLSQTNELKQDWFSSNGSDLEDKMEHKEPFPSLHLEPQCSPGTFEAKMLQQSEFPKLYENNGNLLQSPNDIEHEIIDSETQNQEFPKCDDVIILFQNAKSNGSNESQSDEENESKAHSENNQNKNNGNNEDNEHIALNSEPDNINDIGHRENIKDKSTEKMIEAKQSTKTIVEKSKED